MKYLYGMLMALSFSGGLLTPNLLYGQTPGKLPLVKIIATGGTIANSADGRMSVETILKQIPQVEAIANIEVYDYVRIGSSEISIQNWIDIANVITQELKNNPEIDGVVVTHGSNTSEETAWFLNLVLDTDRPVVITAAQRQRDALSEDSSRNFYDAVRVAAHPQSAGRGVLLVTNEMIHSARDVTKTLGHRVESWNSGDTGVLGLSDIDMIRFYRMPTTRHTANSEFRLTGITRAAQLPRVDIVYAYVDAGPELVQAAVKAGAKGIVVAGFPTGSSSPAMNKALAAARDSGVAIIMGNRGGDGRIKTDREFISADNLSPQKARILLMLALIKKPTNDRLKEIFLSY